MTRVVIQYTVFNHYYLFLSADPPKITQHPNEQSVTIGDNVAFHIEAAGDDLHFQWQKNQIDLGDGDRCCGTHTNKLRIIKVEKDDKGRYRCLVKNLVGKDLSDEAFLTVSEWFIFSYLSGVG